MIERETAVFGVDPGTFGSANVAHILSDRGKMTLCGIQKLSDFHDYEVMRRRVEVNKACGPTFCGCEVFSATSYGPGKGVLTVSKLWCGLGMALASIMPLGGVVIDAKEWQKHFLMKRRGRTDTQWKQEKLETVLKKNRTGELELDNGCPRITQTNAEAVLIALCLARRSEAQLSWDATVKSSEKWLAKNFPGRRVVTDA